MFRSRLHQWFSSYAWPVLCGALLALLYLDYLRDGSEQDSTPAVVRDVSPHEGYAAIVRIASPSVVNIYTRQLRQRQVHPLLNDPVFRRFVERHNRREEISRNLGSGVIASEDGYVLTNNHVIKNADEILVRLADGREQLATVVGTDADTDLAVLKIGLESLTPARFASTADLRVGDIVLAIGNPYGYSQSVSQGIVSATGRYGLQLNTYENFIQTDAATNPGNSGGALINNRGEVIGINTAIVGTSGTSQGIALAIPIETAMHVLNDLVNYGEVVRGWLGIQVQELTPSLAAQFGLSAYNGILLTETVANGPAARAGLRPGDIITHISDMPAGSGNSGMHLVAMIRPGTKINIRVLREGAAQSVWVEVGKREAQSSS